MKPGNRFHLTTLIAVAVFGVSTPALRADDKAADPAAAKPAFREGRRPVKNGTDLDAAKVNPTPVKTTLEKLLDLPRPLDLGVTEPNPAYEEQRAPGETTIWTIEVEIVSYQLMPDGDFKVVLQGESGKRAVVELPDPKLAEKSRWAKEITEVRRRFDERFHPTKDPKELGDAKVKVRITGVGFFGRPNPKGATDNVSGVRLQPAVKLEWLAEKAKKEPAAKQ
jgi:hypothetical protein